MLGFVPDNPLDGTLSCCTGHASDGILYCIREGQLEVLIEGQVIRVLEPGDSFGEVTALWLFDCLRAAPR